MNITKKLSVALQEFLRLEAASGLLLILSAVLAMVAANTFLAPFYAAFLEVPVVVQVGALKIAKPLLLWINDGLMAVFFFLIGLEVKREILEGELSEFSTIAFPAVGALGGMVVPAAIFYQLNHHDSAALSGWAIPLATDVAFALGILAMFGHRVPTSLKVFLLSLAIFDDLGAIIIIAIFYTADLGVTSLCIAAMALSAAVILNRRGVITLTPYLLIGMVMWVSVLKSGVHATLAGVALAFTIPLRTAGDESPLKRMEHELHTPVAYVILPLFAFANAGVAISGVSSATLFHSVTLGIMGGLVLGKFVGVFGFTFIASLLGLARRPSDVSWGQIAGVSVLCGVGFTMSLFIAGLAYQQGHYEHFIGDRIGILIGSAIAASLAIAILAVTLPRGSESAAKAA
ncbi:MAG: Na+/H+ antiporter NhaA [Gammaproteobacteria bacterium]